MCGITGLINRKMIPVNNPIMIDRMLDRIKHRGPDDSGVCGISLENRLCNEKNAESIRENVRGILGFNRLSIQDITYAGHQPMLSSNNQSVITFNGEIYNVKELRHELIAKRYEFRGNSDTEVILNLYQEYGFVEAVKKLNGMFAIVIYDSTKNTLYIARDRYGIIPLHLIIDNQNIIWSSEIKSFLEIDQFARKMNMESILLSVQYSYSNDSLYKNVENMEPGTMLEWNASSDTIRTIKYHDMNEYSQCSYDKKHDYVEELRDILKDCVNRQLIGDVDLGIQLSGGVDSTLLAKYVADEFKGLGKILNGFAMTNHDSPGYDEEKWIDYVADINHVNNKKVDMNFGCFIDALEHSIYAFERPFYTLPPVGIYLFSKRASQDVKILTSGEGADEIGGGYSELFGKYYAYQSLLGASQNVLSDEYDCVGGGMKFIKYFDHIRQLDEGKDLHISADLTGKMEERKAYWDSLTGTSFDKMRKMHFKYRLISMLERQNKVCMASSVENRVPFMDNRFVEFMFSIPEEVLMHKNENVNALNNISGLFEGKYLLKQLSEKIYGSEFAFRKKQAIHAPLSMYFSQPKMKEYIKEIILPGMKQRGMIDTDSFLNRMNHLEESSNVVAVWKYVNLELWCQFFVDGRTEFYK